jgi:uncharacterized protein (TIGR02444 family)
MSFWDWALQAYARPGVADACLRLQDAHDQCVPYLLWAAWAAADGRALGARVLARGAALARAWETAAVSPLRQVRRRLKSPLDDMDDDAREAARGQVKAAELAAERALMQALERLAPERGGRRLEVALALTDAASAWTPQPPLQALRSLAEKLG